MMKRWNILGLVILAAACGGEDDRLGSQAHVCPGVIAGELPGAVLHASAAPAPAATAGDGRQRFLVRYRGERPVSASQVSSLGERVLRVYRQVPAIAVRLTPEEHALLAVDPDVAFIEPDALRRSLGAVPRAAAWAPQPTVEQGRAGEYTQGLHLVEAPWVWDPNQDGKLEEGDPRGEGIRVCVLDTGIDPEHPELRGVIAGGKDFVDGDELPWDRDEKGWGRGHGTHVAGIIAAQLASGGNVSPAMDKNGVAGVAPGARLLIARVLNTRGMAHSSDVIAGLEWCQEQGAHIASLSLGGAHEGLVEREMFQAAADHGMLIIAAAGNGGGPLDFPAGYSSVLAVGAVDHSLRRAPFSAHGPNLSLMAPGVEVLSTIIHEQGLASQLELGDIPYASRPVHLAPAGSFKGRLVDCGLGDGPGSCPEASCEGFVAYVERSQKVSPLAQLAHVMRQGAKAVIIGDPPHEGGPRGITLVQRGHWVPSVLVSGDARRAVRRMVGFNAHVQLHVTDYEFASGTSMAAPHVTGVASILWSARPSLPAAQVRQLLQSTAKDLGEEGWDVDYGHGLVQAARALEALEWLP